MFIAYYRPRRMLNSAADMRNTHITHCPSPPKNLYVVEKPDTSFIVIIE